MHTILRAIIYNLYTARTKIFWWNLIRAVRNTIQWILLTSLRQCYIFRQVFWIEALTIYHKTKTCKNLKIIFLDWYFHCLCNGQFLKKKHSIIISLFLWRLSFGIVYSDHLTTYYAFYPFQFVPNKLNNDNCKYFVCVNRITFSEDKYDLFELE